MEAEDTAVVDDAVDDRGGHVPVAEHVAPSAGLEVRGEDDAAGLVAVRDDCVLASWRPLCERCFSAV